MRQISYPVCGVVVLLASLAPRATAQAGGRLDYRAVEALKDAKYYIARVEGNVKQFEAKSGAWKVGDASVPLREVEGMLGTRDQIDQYLGNVDARFKVLPPTHPEVQKEKKHFDEVKVLVERTYKHLNDLKAGLADVVKQGETEDYKVDAQRLKDINEMFRNTNILQSDPKAAVGIVQQVPNVKAERKRIAEKYAALLNQSTGPAEEMKQTLRLVDGVLEDFEQATKAFATQAPGEIDAIIAGSLGSARQAVAERRPLWFSPTSDILSSLARAQDQAELLVAIAPDAGAPVLAKVVDAKKQAAAMAETLSGDVLETARVPEERYSAADKAEMTDAVRKKWMTDGNGAEIVRAGMNSSGWTRETRWEWNGGAWRKFDRSRTQGFVLAKLDDQTGALHYVNFSKDHLAEDRVAIFFLDDPKETPTLADKVLLKNVE